MNRFEFDKLDKFEQVNYINSELKKSGLTLTKICNKLEIGRSTIRDRFKKNRIYFIFSSFHLSSLHSCVVLYMYSLLIAQLYEELFSADTDLVH